VRRVSLPDSDLQPAALCLGTGAFGTAVAREAAFRLLDRFAELGGNFLDTAHIYAAWVPGGQGASERTLGAWMRSRGVRAQTLIGTKGGHPAWGDAANAPRLAPEQIAQDLSESLDRLQTDYLDLYWLHRDDPSRPVGEIIETLATEQSAGRIHAFGCSNWTWERIAAAQEHARRHGLPGFVASQPEWNLARRNPAAGGDATMLALTPEDVRRHAETGLPCIPYSSQARGYFAGVESAGVLRTYDNAVSRGRRARAQDLARRRGCQPGQIALAYLLAHPFPVIPVIGTSNPAHLEAACAATDIVLSPEDIHWLRDG